MIFKRFTLLILLSLFASLGAQSQESIRVKSTSQVLQLDGKLEEEAWLSADSITSFRLIYLSDSGYARAQTVVKVLRNAQYLYIGAVLLKPDSSGKYVVSSLVRDFPFFENDLLWTVLNPSNDKSNGYAFNVSAAGVQHESQIFNGDTFDTSWDQKWQAEVSHQPGKWVVEIAIPFRSLRFPDGGKEWSINFGRIDNGRNEYSAWKFIPRNLAIGHLSYTVPLQFEDAPVRQGSNLSLIPSITTVLRENYRDTESANLKVTPSLDAKVPLTSSLNLDLTVNPDYSQVEVDATQANLTRFELYFPERRQFFIENNDLFTDYGNDSWFTSDSRPFYTRRIGLYYNPQTQAYESIPILGGARLSGKLNKTLRLGVLSVESARQANFYRQEGSGGYKHLPSQNYTVAVLQQQVFGRSNISGIFVNRQAFGTDSTSGFRYNARDYNRVFGLDYNFLSKDGKWFGKFYHHGSFTGGIERRGYEPDQNTHGSFLRFTGRKVQAFVGHTFVGRDYNPEAGFVPRTNFLNFRSSLRYYMYPKKPDSRLNTFYTSLFHAVYYHPELKKTDQTFVVSGTARFKNRTSISTWLYHEYTKLFFDFDPSRKNDTLLQSGTEYRYAYLFALYQSDNTKPFFFSAETTAGRYFNGQRYSLAGSFNYKAQPRAVFSFNYRVTHVNLPAPFSDNTIWVVGPRADVSFSRSLFFTLLTQYNSLSNNLNIFAKLQWRFRPLSDFYLVYQDYYETNLPTIQINSRNIAAKFIYWF